MLFKLVAVLVWCTTAATAHNSHYHSDYVLERLTQEDSCGVPAQTLAGSVCGKLRASSCGRSYASFRGVPYAAPPLGELRFAAPQPVTPWDGFFNASVEGPVCPQRDLLYGSLLQPRGMSEDCLHANVHAPVSAMPQWGQECSDTACLPVLVFQHGGGFQSGSGDSDINGPEYMMDQNVVFITFNHRLGPIGYLSLNSSSVPGNAGLRDMVAALRWVQDNVRAFGGDPGRVTLMGQGSGASEVHLLSLSEAANGLFQNVILISGTARSGYMTTLPSYSQYRTNPFLKYLGINSTDADEIHRQLVALPYEALLDANSFLSESSGLTVFNPVVESKFDGVTRIIDDGPDVLENNGRGGNYTFLLGFSNNECASLRLRLEEIDVIERIKKNTRSILPLQLLYSVSAEQQAADAQKLMTQYFNGTPTMDQYLPLCRDSLYLYPALKVAQARVLSGGAPVFLYQFSYASKFVPVKQVLGLNYTGSGQFEDLSYILRVNSALKDTTLNADDNSVKDWMTNIVSNFVYCSDPTCGARAEWGPAERRPMQKWQYQDIRKAAYALTRPTADQDRTKLIMDGFFNSSKKISS